MRISQRSVISIGSLLLGFLFTKLSLNFKAICYLKSNFVSLACMKGEMLASFPYVFFGLGIILSICAVIETIEKEKQWD